MLRYSCISEEQLYLSWSFSRGCHAGKNSRNCLFERWRAVVGGMKGRMAAMNSVRFKMLGLGSALAMLIELRITACSQVSDAYGNDDE